MCVNQSEWGLPETDHCGHMAVWGVNSWLLWGQQQGVISDDDARRAAHASSYPINKTLQKRATGAIGRDERGLQSICAREQVS